MANTDCPPDVESLKTSWVCAISAGCFCELVPSDCGRMSKRFYITTAIDYVNGQPHIGHAYEKVIADVIARAHGSMGDEVFYLTGLDEHGQKVQQAAQSEGKTAQQYCDDLAVDWVAFTKTLGLSNDDFVRTSSPRHHAVVQAILEKLNREGHFYKAQYKGYYSTRQETFLTEKDRRPDGTFDPIYEPVTELVEENYYFKMAAQQQWLIDYIEKNPEFIFPSYRRNEVLGFLKNNTLEDLCITRPTARLSWGIPIPFDPAFVTYVWFDALVNYFSIPVAHGDAKALGALPGFVGETTSTGAGPELWPADIHVIGKDILKFHAVYWPIMLKALGAPLPKQLLVHGWWQKDGEKISKSTGNIVDPVAVIAEWGVDAFRYYVTRELDIGPDGNWTDASFNSRYHAELANGIGNTLNRTLSMLRSYRAKVVPARGTELQAEVQGLVDKIIEHYRKHELQDALAGVAQICARASSYIETNAPFKMARVPEQAGRLDEILYNLLECCRLIAICIWPVMPASAEKIYAQLNLPGKPDKFAAAKWGALEPGHTIGEPAALFPRKDQPPKK
jgi:methionyl-tRNA synthetase